METDFINYLDKTSLERNDREVIKAIFSFFDGSYLNVFANRSFLFEGDPGIGKTFLAKKLLQSLDKPTIYVGQSEFKGKQVKRIQKIDGLLKELEGFKEGIVYIDDLRFIFNFKEEYELENEDRKKLMNLMEYFRDNDNKTVLILTLNDSCFLEESQRDRLDVVIKFDLPSEADKLNFLNSTFKEHVEGELLEYLTKNSMGYNYRDLPSVLKSAYFYGDKTITKESLIRALDNYVPAGLSRFNVKQGIKFGLKDLFLEGDLKGELDKLVSLIKNGDKLKESGVSKSKFLIFEGPAGVGKTHVAMALAGELGIPLIKVRGREVFYQLESVFHGVGRFGKGIFLFDDADKLFERQSMDVDDGGTLFAELNRSLDGLEDKGAVLIMSANDANRFGIALRDRFKVIKFENPTNAQILGYFNQLKSKSKVQLNVSDNELLLFNQGKNFRGLQRFWNECIFYAVHNNKHAISMEDIALIFPSNQTKSSSSMFG